MEAEGEDQGSSVLLQQSLVSEQGVGAGWGAAYLGLAPSRG